MHRSFVGRDYRQLFRAEGYIVDVLYERFEHLVCRLDVVKARQRHRVLYPRIVRVEGYDVRHAHIGKILERYRAVERFSRHPAVLTSLVEHRHYHGDPSRLSADGAYYTLEVGKVVVGTHPVRGAVHIVAGAVVEAVGVDIGIVSAHRLHNYPLAFAGGKSRTLGVDDIGLVGLAAPVLYILVNALDKAFAPLGADNTEVTVKFLTHGFLPSLSQCVIKA